MPAKSIKKIYLLSQTHTDLGYTDHVASVLLHHRDIFDRVLEVCEDTFDDPPGEQHRWTCELTSTTLDYLRSASPQNVDRFVALHRAGRIAVCGLRYHWTPLVSKALAIETLRDIDELRGDYGIDVRTAMQCDVNGLAWYWNDLLLERGIDSLCTQQNPHRGYWGSQVPSAWRWGNRSGGELLVLQGEHYWRGGFMGLARAGKQDREDLSRFLKRHEESGEWPFDFSVVTVTNTANADNGFPDAGLCPAVRQWNADGGIPMEIVTLDQLAGIVSAARETLPLRSGEWMDSWSDGEASTPLETAAARSAERLLPIIQEFTPRDDPVYRELVDSLCLYDEHTWGAYSAAAAPYSVFTAIQRTQKSNHAYRAYALALRLLAVGSRRAVPDALGKVEGDPSFSSASHEEEGPDGQAYLVANPCDFEIDVDWPVPLDRGAGPQISVPQYLGTNIHTPGLGDVGWSDALHTVRPDGEHRLRAALAPREARVIRPVRSRGDGCRAGEGWIESSRARLEFDPDSGGLMRWEDSATRASIECCGSFAPGVQLLKAGWDRRRIFLAPYWERSEVPMQWNQEELFEEDGRNVVIEPGWVDAEGAHLRMKFEFGCGIGIEAVWTLPEVSPSPRLRAIQRCAGFDTPFSVNWPVRFPGFGRTYADTGDGLVDAVRDHVPSSCLAWQSVQSGIALMDDGGSSIAIASPDAPLYQPGGPTFRDPHDPPSDASGGVFWSINTHWDTNFPVRVTDHVPFRLALGLAEGGAGGAHGLLRRMAAVPAIVRAPYAKEGPVDGYWPKGN